MNCFYISSKLILGDIKYGINRNVPIFLRVISKKKKKKEAISQLFTSNTLSSRLHFNKKFDSSGLTL